MTFTLPANIAAHFPCCPVCRSQNRAIALHSTGQVACLDTVACAKDADALAEWCDSKAEELSAIAAMERGIPLW